MDHLSDAEIPASTQSPSSPSTRMAAIAPDQIFSSSAIHSSPLSTNSSGTQRIRKPPSITPRKFKRFFYPSENREGGGTPDRKPLSDLTASLNALSRPIISNSEYSCERPTKRIRMETVPTIAIYSQQPVHQLNRISRRPIATRVLYRETAQKLESVSDYQELTADLHQHTTDVFTDDCQIRTPETHAPWSVACCRSNPIAAVGLGDGAVAIVDTFRDCLEDPASSKPGLPQLTRLHISPNYPIVEVRFSRDDRSFAACDTSSTTIVDLSREKAIWRIKEPPGTVCRLQWAPTTSDAILATTGRSGNIRFWDLRASHIKPTLELGLRDRLGDKSDEKLAYAKPISCLIGAHSTIPSLQYRGIGTSTKWREGLRTKSYVAPTALAVSDLCFLPNAGMEHYLLSSSSRAGPLRLWDIRTATSNSSIHSQPMSTVGIDGPAESSLGQSTGLTSICVDDDGSRVFGVGRDSRVHVWSISHLAFGQTVATLGNRELAVPSYRGPMTRSSDEQIGAAPIYQIQMPNRSVRSGHIRCSYRPPANGKPAMLAVGSSNGSPYVIPTEDTVLRHASRTPSFCDDPAETRSGVANGRSRNHSAGRQLKGLPIENPGVAWTSQSHLLGIFDLGRTLLWRDHAGAPDSDCRKDKRVLE